MRKGVFGWFICRFHLFLKQIGNLCDKFSFQVGHVFGRGTHRDIELAVAWASEWEVPNRGLVRVFATGGQTREIVLEMRGVV
jgi:hypothetical protein